MNHDVTLPRYVVALWLLPALLLSAVPLPSWLGPFWPDWLLLLIIAFGLASPRSCGPGTAFVTGLALDAFRGILLGQHAFAFVVVAWLVHRFRLRLRMFTPLHQAMVVLSLLWAYQFLLFWIDGVSGHPLTYWGRWLPVLTGAAVWPWLYGWLSRHVVRH